MKIVKSFFSILICIMLCATITGCGKEETGQKSQTKQPSEQQSGWKAQGFAIYEDTERDGELNIRQFALWERDAALNAEEGKNIFFVDFGSCGELIWRLNEVTEKGGRSEWVLEIYDAFTEESTVKKFSYEELGLENNDGMLMNMDLIDRDHYVFQWVEAERDEEGYFSRWTADRMIYTDFAEELYSVDLWPGYLEAGLVDGGTGHRLLEGNCDGKGNTYVLASLGKSGYASVYLFDREGKMILEYGGEQFQTVHKPLRTWEGELIFPVRDSQNKRVEYLWADTERGEMCSLAQEDVSSPNIFLEMYGMQGNDIYYKNVSKEIVKWNIESGERTKILNLQENGLGVGQILMALSKEGNHPVLCLVDQNHGKEWLAPLTDQEIPDREIVRFANLVKSWDNTINPTANSVSLAASLNRDFFYQYEVDSTEESRTRVLADLSSGNGPDLMYVSLEDMRMLEEKGALLDMRELLPEARVREMLPGAVEIGAIDGKLVGIPMQVEAQTLMVARDTWSKDSWNLEDVIRLMENGELEGGIYYITNYYYPLATVKMLIKYNLADSFLIDWEKRESHFDDERFLRLLELTYKNLNDGYIETDTRLNGGKRISWEGVGSGTNDSSFDVAREWENGHYVGFPTSGGCGNYLTTEGVIVVNATTKNKEAVLGYLEVLCSSEFQISLVKAGAFGYAKKGYIDPDSGKLMWSPVDEIGTFPDNTTSIDRANAFLRECVAAPPEYTALEEIIAEELNDMYEQNRDPKDVVKVINNRVQLYLDEGN